MSYKMTTQSQIEMFARLASLPKCRLCGLLFGKDEEGVPYLAVEQDNTEVCQFCWHEAAQRILRKQRGWFNDEVAV